MTARAVFNWIRAVSKAEMSDGCRAFCLQLIPLVDSSELVVNRRSLYDIAREVSAAESSIKRYKRTLKELGLLMPSSRWELAINGEKASEPKSSITTDTRTADQYQQRYPEVSAEQPSIYYRSTSLSTRERDSLSRPNQTFSLENLTRSIRPDVGDRVADLSADILSFERAWSINRGKDWPWPKWSTIVLPYLTREEREELLRELLKSPNPNLMFATSIVSRICRGESKPMRQFRAKRNPCAVPIVVPGRSRDDDEWLEKISQ